MSTIIKQKRLYLYSQSFCVNSETLTSLYKLRYIISDHKLEEENWYRDADSKGLSFDQWLKSNWHPLYNLKNKKEDGDNGQILIEEMTECSGWNGLYQLLPNILPGSSAEFIMSIEVDPEDYIYYDDEDEEIKIEDIENPDFTLSYNFNVMRNSNEIMIGWGKNEPYFEIEDGFVKWDVANRRIATLLFGDTPLDELFGYSGHGNHGAEKPYKAKITIKGVYL